MKNIFIYTLIAAILIIGGYLVFFKKTPKVEPTEFTGRIIEKGRNGKISGEYPLRDIINLDEPYQCEFMRDDGENEVKGKISIAPGAKVRGDFDIKSPITKDPFQSHFIIQNNVIYTWTSLLNAGFKSPLSATTSASSNIAAIDEIIKYDCSPYTPDQTQFSLPADIIFRDLPATQ